jgi:hypothetical protein
VFQSLKFPLHLLFFLSQLNKEENRENIAASPEGSTSGEDSSDSGEGGSGGSSSSSSSSDEGSNDGQASEHEGGCHELDVLSEPCTPLRLPVHFVDSLSFSEQMFCKL